MFVVALIFITGRVSTTVSSVSLAYPVVSGSNVDSLVCYMQKADGTVLDLEKICQNSTKNVDIISQLLETKQCQRCNLSGANLSGTNLSGANLAGANLNGANLSGTNLSGANLSGASVNGTNLSGANLNGTIMPNGKLSQS
jgi:uncharacterized protein YjbI with pentapeptide repeats